MARYAVSVQLEICGPDDPGPGSAPSGGERRPVLRRRAVNGSSRRPLDRVFQEGLFGRGEFGAVIAAGKRCPAICRHLDPGVTTLILHQLERELEAAVDTAGHGHRS